VSAKIPTVVLGGTGYVAGELLRLIAGHPQFELAAVMSDSQPGESVSKAFPHLVSAYSDVRFKSQADVARLLVETPQSAVFSAAPHGVSAALIDSLLSAAAQAGTRPRVVDISADFRYSSAEAYEAVYKHAHGAPKRIAEVHLCGARASEAIGNHACSSPRLLCHRYIACERATSGPGPDFIDTVRGRCHRQHGRRTQAD